MDNINAVIGFDVRIKSREIPEWVDVIFEKDPLEFVVSVDSDVCKRPSHWIENISEEMQNYFYYLKDIPDTKKNNSEIIIAITSTDDYANYIISEQYGMPLITANIKTSEDLIKNGWKFLGFDLLTNLWAISGLSNCGLYSDAIDFIKEHNFSKLNKYFLFSDYLSISLLKQMRDKTIPNHEPFEISGVWLAPEL